MSEYPEAVSNAIAAVMGDIPKLAREETNKHANYKFASIDDFLDAVRPLCAKHSLVIEQDELSFDIVQTMDKYGKPSDWLRMAFGYTVAVGGSSRGPIKRSIMVRADMGSQAFGAAQSYSLKQFMRSLFQISTGDDESDTSEQSIIAGTVKDAFPDGPHKNKSNLDKGMTAYLAHIDALTNSDDLEEFITEQSPLLAQYRAYYGRDSDYWSAIAKQNTNARARVTARAELPADAEPMQLDEPAHLWSESTTRLVSQIATRETTKALEAWVNMPATKAIMATLDQVEMQYVRGAYTDRAKAINAMEVAGA